MKAVTVKTIKDELSYKDSKELMELCLRLSKFKKEINFNNNMGSKGLVATAFSNLIK